MFLLAAGLLVSCSSWAQNAPVPPPATVPLARPAAPRGVNVLVVALDDEVVVVPEAPPLAGALPDPPAPDVPLTAITPARFDAWQPVWRVFAKKEKPDPRFLPNPEAPSQAPILSRSGTALPGNASPGANPLFGTSGQSLERPSIPAGRGLLAALPLARALGGLGYANVQTTSPGGAILSRALGEKRLLPGTLTALRDALKSMQSAAKLPERLRKGSLALATSRANNAACAIGQATGYRAVVALYVAPFENGVSSYSVVLSDSTNEKAEPLLWNESARDEATARDIAAATGAALLDKAMDTWTPASPSALKTLADVHLARARAAGVEGDLNGVQDEVARVLTLDATRADALVLLGDLLAPTDLAGAAAAYKRALALNGRDGATFEKMAIAYAGASAPDWPRALEAGQKALGLGTDTANLRIAMARAQFGRADLFRSAPRAPLIYKAEDAEAEAQNHLDRALQLSPDNSEALRLLARALMTSGRTTEAVQTLDRVVPLFPKDADLQRQYANALLALGDRKEDAFVAYSRLLKLSANSPSVDSISYTALAQGFDEHVFSLGKSSRQLADGVATASIARESAFLQLARLKSDMADAESTIALMRVPPGFSKTAATARVFAASLMVQSLEAHQTFLDTGQDVYRSRAGEFYRQAVAQLNMARNAK